MNQISKVEPSISKFLQYQRFFVNLDIEAGNLILKVVYSILKQPSILKASISKKSLISGVARGSRWTLLTPLLMLPLLPLHHHLPLLQKQHPLQHPLKNSSCWRPPPIKCWGCNNWRQGWQQLIKTCLSLHWCDYMHWSSIQCFQQGRIAAANQAGLNQYIPVHTICTIQQILVLQCTSMYLHILFLGQSLACTTLYHLVPPCTIMVQASTYKYIPVCTDLRISYASTYW